MQHRGRLHPDHVRIVAGMRDLERVLVVADRDVEGVVALAVEPIERISPQTPVLGQQVPGHPLVGAVERCAELLPEASHASSVGAPWEDGTQEVGRR